MRVTIEEARALAAKPKRRDSDKLESAFVNAAKLGRLPLDVREHRFAPPRRWRFDFAWREQKLAVEIEGGTYVNGGHNRGKAYADNCEKYNAAVLHGWRVLRYTTDDMSKRPLQVIDEVKEALAR